MAVRSRRIVGPQLVTNSAALLFTVPADRTLIVRQLSIHNSSSTLNQRVRLHVNGATTVFRWLRTADMAPLDVLQLEGWWAFNPGDTIQGTAEISYSGSTGPYATLFGSLLDGAPA